VIGERAFREAIRTVTVSYPIPFLVTVLLASAVLIFSLSALVGTGVLRWLLAGCAIATMLTALGIVVYGVGRRPELLRSERFTLLSRYFEVIGDSAMTPEARSQMNVLLSTLDDEARKEPGPDGDAASVADQEEDDA